MLRWIFILFLFFSVVFTQSLDQLFNDGNNFYNKNSFNKAIENYNKILDSGFFSQDLYLNLGNAYFEVEDFGNARWSYEMGLKLNPFNEDLINNNNVNKSFIENYIEVPKNSILDNVNIFFQSLSVNQFILINSILVLITSILFFIYKMFESKKLKKIFIYSSIFSSVFLLLVFTKNMWDINNKFGIIIENESKIFDGLGDKLNVWMSHGDQVQDLPDNFKLIASTTNAPIAAMQHESKEIFALQFHPEVTHTNDGHVILNNFIFNVCNAKQDWKMDDLISQRIQEIKDQVKDQKVLLGLSGGVDSSVTAANEFTPCFNK